MNLTQKLLESLGPNMGFEIQVRTTEMHGPMTNHVDKNYFKSQMAVHVFEKQGMDETGKPIAAKLVKKSEATGTSTNSMEEAEDNALKRALMFLGL